MLPVEVVRSYQEIIWHLLDEIQRLQMANIRLQGDVKNLQEYVPEPVPDAAREGQPTPAPSPAPDSTAAKP